MDNNYRPNVCTEHIGRFLLPADSKYIWYNYYSKTIVLRQR